MMSLALGPPSLSRRGIGRPAHVIKPRAAENPKRGSMSGTINLTAHRFGDGARDAGRTRKRPALSRAYPIVWPRLLLDPSVASYKGTVDDDAAILPQDHAWLPISHGINFLDASAAARGLYREP